MKLYAIYAGLNGGFGGAVFKCLKNFENSDDANSFAEILAREEYELYEEMCGIEYEQESDYEYEVNSWIEYKAVEIETAEELIELAKEESIDSDTVCHFVTETFHK